ncbi:MAG: STT3 domain-containing protein [Elusimicrobia bacterium]|nr:STT3 domain-containing protein [Elusimicrobiota bacterium]
MKNKKLVLIILGIFLLAFAVRVIPFISATFYKGKVIFYDPDSYYHMRRIMNMLQNNFNMVKFDYYLNYPEGNVSIWPDGFDKMTAAFVWILSLGKPAKELAERIACYFPPLVGAASIILVWMIGKILFNNTCGILAALFMALQPVHIFYSKLGRVDHHVAETFSTLLMYWFFIKLLKSLELSLITKFSSSRRFYLWSVLTGAGIWFSYTVWTGATIYLGSVLLTMYLSLYTVSGSEILKHLKAYFAVLMSTLIFLLYPCLTSWWGRQGMVSFKALSLFQIYLLIFSITFFLIAFISFKIKIFSKLKNIHLLFGVTIVYCIFIVLCSLFFPEIKNQFIEGLNFLAKRGAYSPEWLEIISENKPLLYVNGKFNLYTVIEMLTWGFFIMPVGLFVFTIVTIKREKDYPVSIFVMIWTVTFGIIAFKVIRYSYNFGACVSLFSAYTFYLLYEELEKRKISLAPFLKPKHISYVVILILLYSNSKLLKNKIVSERPTLSPSEYELLSWIKDNTPVTSFYNNPVKKPEYGIMCLWSWGHFIEYVSERPAAVNPYGQGIEKMIKFYLARNEKEANKIMEENNFRYCITSDPTMVLKWLREMDNHSLVKDSILTPKGYQLNISNEEFSSYLTIRLHLFDGSYSSFLGMGIEELRHYRLLFETAEYIEFPCSGINVRTAREKVFEYVKGACYYGNTTSNTEIKISIPVITNIDREFVYTYKTKSDSMGNFELTFPYSTYGAKHQVRTKENYTVSIGKEKRYIKVSEEDVIKGYIIQKS